MPTLAPGWKRPCKQLFKRRSIRLPRLYHSDTRTGKLVGRLKPIAGVNYHPCRIFSQHKRTCRTRETRKYLRACQRSATYSLPWGSTCGTISASSPSAAIASRSEAILPLIISVLLMVRNSSYYIMCIAGGVPSIPGSIQDTLPTTKVGKNPAPRNRVKNRSKNFKFYLAGFLPFESSKQFLKQKCLSKYLVVSEKVHNFASLLKGNTT